MRNLDLNRVAAFARVVHDGSFTDAAKALGVPKSSVSRSVAQLEDELGVRLLHRTTRKLHLTEAGAAFYDRASRALADLTEATDAAADTRADLRGVVRLSAPVDLGITVLAPVIAAFVVEHPAIRVDVSLANRYVDLVAEGFDLALRVGSLGDSSLVARRVGTLESALWAAPAYIERRGRPEKPADLGTHDVITFRSRTGRSIWTLTAEGGAEETVDVGGPVGADDLSFILATTVAGGGISLMPRFLCVADEASGALVRVLPSYGIEGAVFSIVSPSARFVPQRVNVLRDYLLRELAKVDRMCKEKVTERAEAKAKKRRS